MKFNIRVWQMPESYQWGFSHGIVAAVVMIVFAVIIALAI